MTEDTLSSEHLKALLEKAREIKIRPNVVQASPELQELRFFAPSLATALLAARERVRDLEAENARLQGRLILRRIAAQAAAQSSEQKP
jgi:hypothetical protein